MFTGIVEYQAKILAVEKTPSGKQIKLEFDEERLKNLVEGASVAVNGVCLTATKIENNKVHFDLIEETLSKTNFNDLDFGDFVNIERALKFGDEIGGHLLSGHILKTVPFLGYDEEKKYHFFAGDKEIQPYEETIKDFRKKKMVYSFFLDMIALTIADGIIQDNEHKLLARVCNELGLQLNFMHNLLYFSLSSSYTQLDELFEPIYQTFFDTVLHWIKELDALIFNQTTFSINPEVDSLLKRLYKNYTL